MGFFGRSLRALEVLHFSRVVTVGVFFCAASIALYQLTEIPPTWYDEGMVVQLAVNLARYGEMGTQIAPQQLLSGGMTSSGFPVVFPVAVAFKLFDVSLFVARVVMVGYLLAFLVLVYVFVRRIAHTYAALASCALLTTFASLYGNGKNVLGEVPGLFFLVAFLLFLHRFFDRNEQTTHTAFFAGLFLGLTIVTKPVFLVLGGAVVCGLLYFLFFEKRTFSLRFLWYAILGTLLPVILWFVTQFSLDDSFSRLYAFYANPYHLTNIPQLMQENAMRFLTEGTPLHLAFFVALWIATILYRLWIRVRVAVVEVVGLTFVLLIIGAYLRTPGWYRYLFPAQLLTLAFSGLVFFQIFTILKGKIRAVPAFLIVGSVVCVLVALQGYHLLFSSWLSAQSDADKTRNLARHFVTYDQRTTVFVYDYPEAVLFLPPGVPYYQYIAINPHDEGLGAEHIARISEGVPDVIVTESDIAADKSGIFAGYREVERVNDMVVFVREGVR